MSDTEFFAPVFQTLPGGAPIRTSVLPYLERAAQELPAEKLLFGFDAPLVDARVQLSKVRLLKLPKDKGEKIVGGNIRRLLRMQKATSP
jgi:predicted TIM-barrel fold metal-dependent hydrolase